jgi:hypothetical protein
MLIDLLTEWVVLKLVAAAALAAVACALLGMYPRLATALTRAGLAGSAAIRRAEAPASSRERLAEPQSPRLAPGSQLPRLGTIFDRADGHIDTIRLHQRSASIQIDAAEHALNHLLAEIARVMPLASIADQQPATTVAGPPAPGSLAPLAA